MFAFIEDMDYFIEKNENVYSEQKKRKKERNFFLRNVWEKVEGGYILITSISSPCKESNTDSAQSRKVYPETETSNLQ